MADAGSASTTASLHGVRIVVVHEQQTVRTHLGRVLANDGATVAAITRAELAVVRHGIDVVFFADPQPDLKHYCETIRLARSCFPHSWLLASYTEQGAQTLTPLIQAGADDVLRVPTSGADELRVRLGACRRLTQRTSDREHDWTSISDLSHQRAWREIPDQFARELASFSSLDFHPTAARPDGVVAVEIPVTMGRDRLEVLVQIRMSEQGAQSLCAAMLGMPQADRAVVDDLARETANTLAGAYKRSAEDDGVGATIGLPRFVPTENRSPRAAHRFALGAGDVIVAIDCLLCPIEDQIVNAVGLREGMVVVKEVRTAGGALLIPAGIRLTASAAARLASHLGDKATVTVAMAA
jgi:CheY-like chemotaxis protein